MQTRYDYWEECLAQSLEEHGVAITKEQLTAVTHDVEGAHECYGMAFHMPEHPAVGELEKAKAELKAEQALVFCRECQGSGRLHYNSGPWAVDTVCHKCNGRGKHN